LRDEVGRVGAIEIEVVIVEVRKKEKISYMIDINNK
jgi:hypothetical protein